MVLEVPIYLCAVGGVAVVVGFFAFGRRVLETVGTKITVLSYRSGFVAQFSSAFTVLFATVLGNHNLWDTFVGV